MRLTNSFIHVFHVDRLMTTLNWDISHILCVRRLSSVVLSHEKHQENIPLSQWLLTSNSSPVRGLYIDWIQTLVFAIRKSVLYCRTLLWCRPYLTICIYKIKWALPVLGIGLPSKWKTLMESNGDISLHNRAVVLSFPPLLSHKLMIRIIQKPFLPITDSLSTVINSHYSMN